MALSTTLTRSKMQKKEPKKSCYGTLVDDTVAAPLPHLREHPCGFKTDALAGSSNGELGLC
jgi:hypothetical protein